MNNPRITFGMIVLNGEPFLEYNLRALYPFAHQIIVVEGVAQAAKGVASSDGHSIDGTLETLRRFQAEEDPDRKLEVVSAEDEGYHNGFWPGEKHQMSQAYARRATGNYLWQIDVDEFYKPENMEKIVVLLRDNPNISGASFHILYFWGSPNYKMDGFAFRTGAKVIHRVFAWQPGFTYVTHRPPTVLDHKGRDLRTLNWMRSDVLARMGIHIYHYDMLLPKQAIQKSNYYSNVDWHDLEGERIRRWLHETYVQFLHPFRVSTMYKNISWLVRYHGIHPPQIETMLRDIASGRFPGIELRRIDDIEKKLKSFTFRFLLPVVKTIVIIQIVMFRAKMWLRRALLDTCLWPVIQQLRGRA